VLKETVDLVSFSVHPTHHARTHTRTHTLNGFVLQTFHICILF